jgi:hypothetical protein
VLPLILLAACAAIGPGEGPVDVHRAPPPSADEHYCAWFGDSDGRILYFGQSPFWSAMRAGGGDPLADLERPGPALIGRFDLQRERLLSPLVVATIDSRSGVWDVLAHPNGRVYFTTFADPAGSIDRRGGDLQRFPKLGSGLNELAPGPDGTILATRYPGGIVVLDREGTLVAEFPLAAPEGYLAAAKTPAWDPARRELWVTTDLLPTAGGEPRHDAYVLDDAGREKRRIASPEVQFVVFGADGTGYRAEVEGTHLWLRWVPPPDAGPPRSVSLDEDFPTALDFVQNIGIAADGRAVVTRWSGRIHLVAANGSVETVTLPAGGEGGLYYSAVLTGDRLCATRCADVEVVCRAVP